MYLNFLKIDSFQKMDKNCSKMINLLSFLIVEKTNYPTIFVICYRENIIV